MSPRASIIAQEWFTAAELADLKLPGLATSKRGVQMIADREGWATYRDASGAAASRKRAGRGGGLEYHVSLLPEAARKHLASVRPAKAELADRESTLLRYERLPQSLKDEALRRLGCIQRVEQLQRAGMTKTGAIKETVAEAVRLANATGAKPEVSERTLHEWFGMIAGVEPQDRAMYLAPRYAGRVARAECPTAAWEAYKTAYLRQEKPTHARCYRDVQKLAGVNGWTLPSAKYFERRIVAEIPEPVIILSREGPKAARHTYAYAARSKEGLYPHAVANLDGHLWDVQVEWEDGSEGRPYSLAVQDIASSMPLGLRFDRTLNSDIVRLALGDTFRDFGLVERLIMDNGSENQAKQIQGGIHRMRGPKSVEEEPAGLLKILGIEAVSATPYWGQAKPVERMFRDWAHDLAKDPRFAGAYTGHNAISKPENHRSRAVPIAEFERIVRQELEFYRDQLGRSGVGMNGRSFRQVYLEGVAAQPPRRLTAEQLRYCMLASEPRGMDPASGAVSILGNRYWSPELSDLKRQKVVARFDPDDLSKDVFLYSLDGRFLLQVPRQIEGDFTSVVTAKKITSERRKQMRRIKDAKGALVRLGIDDLAAQLDAVVPSTQVQIPADATNVVVPAFGVPRRANTTQSDFTADADRALIARFQGGS